MNTKRLVAVGHISPERDEIMCDPTFEPTWASGIERSIDALPETMDMCDAYELGRLDALDSHPCRPGQYEQMTHQCEYALGWVSVAGRNATTLALLEPKPTPVELMGLMCMAMMDSDPYLDDTLGYEDEIEEREFIRFGGS